ncbi:MAG: carbohydrate porin [Bdellovibrionales bacterium]|nr:carbohydrate porin [Oligoflexia bacterium]
MKEDHVMSHLIKILICFCIYLGQAQSFAQPPTSPTSETEIPSSSTSPSAPSRSEIEWSQHFQLTTVTQTHSGLHSPYSGPLSLTNRYEIPSSLTATLFIGHRLWQNAYAFVNPEESIGAGLNSTHGIAAFPNGEVYRVDDPSPKINLSRLFIQQDFNLGHEKEKIEDDANQFDQEKSIERITVVAGKFSLNDYLDGNSYSHDPRTQFFNWALMDTGAWDYAADTRGYTWGVMTELHLKKWSVRFALVQVPAIANGIALEGDLKNAHAENLELEYRYALLEHPGKMRLLLFSNQARMGNYRTSIRQGLASAQSPDITDSRTFSSKTGFALNLEQEISSDLGTFARLGWNDGSTETWAFTEIDRSIAFGLSLKGSGWTRPSDVFGLAVMLNGLSKDHADYLGAGGLGFIIGDGKLNYALEQIIETYYSLQLFKSLSATADFQGVNHPGYNADRGPLAVYGFRLHFEI